MIEVKGLVKYYGERRVLHGLDFTVSVGHICGLLGPNGSGKSTTMDILAGLLGPSDGTALICGMDVVANAQKVKKKIGYLPDNPPLHEEMKVGDYLDYVAQLKGISSGERKAAIEYVLNECDVSPEINRVIGHLSKGYKQRVALCAALVHKPEVLILDEPTEGLDPSQILHIRQLIKKLAKDRTVIMSSHILSEVEATCDEVIIINQGKIVAQTVLDSKEDVVPRYVFAFPEKHLDAVTWLQNNENILTAELYNNEKHSVLVNLKPDFWKKEGIQGLAKINTSLVQNGFSAMGISPHKTPLEEMFFNAINTQVITEVNENI